MHQPAPALLPAQAAVSDLLPRLCRFADFEQDLWGLYNLEHSDQLGKSSGWPSLDEFYRVGFHLCPPAIWSLLESTRSIEPVWSLLFTRICISALRHPLLCLVSWDQTMIQMLSRHQALFCFALLHAVVDAQMLCLSCLGNKQSNAHSSVFVGSTLWLYGGRTAASTCNAQTANTSFLDACTCQGSTTKVGNATVCDWLHKHEQQIGIVPLLFAGRRWSLGS